MEAIMHTIATLNKISASGLERFPDDYIISDNVNLAEGILVRSHAMLEMNFSENLLAIARAGAGVNNIPIKRCAEEGIVVFNTPGANANAVKELVLSGIFLAARNLPDALEWTKSLKSNIASQVEKGKSQFAGNEIRGKTLGIIGLGYIGVGVANTTEKLGMDVIGYDPFISVKAAHELSRKIPLVSALEDMLPKCDYISIHVPAMESTKSMIGEKQFAMMKKDTCFLNFSRDTLVNDDALLAAIDSGIIKKYITDFPNEKLLGNDGIVCLPHLGASTEEAEELCAIMAADQLIEYLENGNIINSVNYPNCSMGPLEHSAAACRICILNKNIAGMLTKITGIFADMNINISDMVNKSKGDYSYTVLDIDSDVEHDELKKQLQFEGIIAVRILK
jgi:D-3-phosphoglycerate dehydrogenase